MSMNYFSICSHQIGSLHSNSLAMKTLTKTINSPRVSTIWTRGFSATTPWQNKNKNNQQKIDPRVTLIRYHMQHPIMPRPLRLGRSRALRHWTIARAWDVWEKRKKRQVDLELQRQYQSIQMAMEALRNFDDGSAVDGKEGSRLYRIALEKKGVYSTGSIPIEYARLQTDTPGATPWDHDWKR
ncbi:hypothetical protein GcM1_245016 [Golovinomyces cichoracearum]|uniref:Ring finger domain protein n=1 Tax=Golovinomyces cichoracearum TaxID=62708 RepID=A0A420IF12_9PEZI|nr:hypothetical protein GcM1_245016 [Golovinomyces cichoracearum]